MKRVSIAACVLLFGSAIGAETITVSDEIPFAEDAVIKGAIKKDCALPTKFPPFIESFGKEFGVDVKVSSSASKSDPAYLHVEITDAVSRGNAFIGHTKFTEATGTLYRNGEEVASFVGQRYSGGGAFGGYKGSCSVLGRTVKALGKDIALWLQNPEDGAQLGDLK